jgi:hypothetical protein
MSCERDVPSLFQVSVRRRPSTMGAKTAAGYGWFDASIELQKNVQDALRAGDERRKTEQQQIAEKEQKKREEEGRRRKKEEIARATEGMTAEQKAAFEMTSWPAHKFKDVVQKLSTLPPEQKVAVYVLLRGERVSIWKEIRQLALEGKQKDRTRWSSSVQELFKMAKERKEKMP